MTNIEMSTMNLLQSACKKYVQNSEKIDWEQRRYEIAKECMAQLNVTHFADGYESEENCARMAVKAADVLIAELKK